MSIQIRIAERKKAKLRIGMSGPSGSGKTYSALLVARGMATSWEKVLLIDSENGSGELYSDLGPYNVITLTAPFAPERYVEAISAAEAAGMEVIVIDSTSHEWDGKGGCLEINELIAKTKFKGNTWSAWSETTPRHQRFLEAIVTSPCHIVTTARSKTDTIQTEDKKIKKVGLKEVQREGFEYELTVNFNIDREGHLALASKDRTGLFIDRDPFIITQKTGEELLAWNDAGKEVVPDYTADKKKVFHNLQRLGFVFVGTDDEKRDLASSAVSALTGMDITDEPSLGKIVESLETYKAVETAQALYAEYMSARTPKPVVPDSEPEPFPEAVSGPDDINPDDIPF